MSVIAASVLLGIVVHAGCQAPPPPRRSMSLIRLPGVSRQQAFQTTQAVLGEFDFRLESIDPDAGFIRSFAREETVRGGTGRISDPIVRSPNRVRRIAEAYVRGGPDGAEVRLAVSRERLDTASYRAFAREHQEEDMPTETPIDREAGTSPGQYESWTPIGRDRALETSIRRALEERLARAE
jgi:hypothetical protein